MFCNKAPDGWICARLDGHDGPCAATRDDRSAKEWLKRKADMESVHDVSAGSESVFEQSVMDRLAQEELASLKVDYPEAEIGTGCEKRYAVRVIPSLLDSNQSAWNYCQWWEVDTLAEVRARIEWALAHR